MNLIGHIKKLLFVAVFVLLVGCGANVNYNVDVNTKNKTIKIDTILEIDESDYSYIKGGREKLISIMENKKPDEMSFEIDQENENRFIFSTKFNDYNDYLIKYKKITGSESISQFNIVDYSKETPFQSYQNIKIEDDLSHLLDWLKESIINEKVVDSENISSLIHSQNYEFVFDDENVFSYQYDKEYTAQSFIDITQITVNINIKKDNNIDFLMSIILDEKKVGNFTENFISYIKQKDVDLNLYQEQIIYKDIPSIKYNIELKNIDLSDEKSRKNLNTVFGENFNHSFSKNFKESTIFKDDYQQSVDLQFDFNTLFDIDYLYPIAVTVDLDKVELDKNKHPSEFKLPVVTENLKNGNYQYTIYVVYTSYKFIAFASISVFILIIVLGIYKFGYKKILKKINNILNLCYKKTFVLLEKYLFENEFEIHDSIIKGNSFIIQINNINKIYYGREYEAISYLLKCLVGLLIGIILLNTSLINPIIGWGTLVCSLIVMIISFIKYKTKAIHLRLVSGKQYSFYFKDDIIALKIYNQLLNVMENEKNGEEVLESILKSAKRKDNNL